jgi:hypothetical protein
MILVKIGAWNEGFGWGFCGATNLDWVKRTWLIFKVEDERKRKRGRRK